MVPYEDPNTVRIVVPTSPSPSAEPQSPTLSAALEYAELGYPVFPLRPDEKLPAISHWNTDASTDPGQLQDWFASGNYNIGMLTGTPSGFFAVDIDPRNGGDYSLECFENTHGPLPDTVVQHTQGGGQHFLFNMPPAPDFGNRTLSNYPGIDIKSTGGYIVVPPSRIGTRGYVWEDSSRLGEVSIADAPADLLDLIRLRPQQKSSAPEPVILEGIRNSTLASQAGKLRAMGLAEAEITAALLSINQNRCRPPLPDQEVRTIARSIARYEPRQSITVQGQDEHTEIYNQTDVGNAERLIARHGADLRFCTPRNQWIVWDGIRWQPDPGSVATSRAIETVRRMYAEAGRLKNPDDRAKHANHAMGSERVDRLKAMLWVAAHLEGVSVQPGELDGDPYLLNLLNGTLNLNSLELQPHTRGDLITRIAPVAFDPDAQCPTWKRFLHDVMDGDPKMIAYLQRAAGLCLSGDTRARAFFFLYGTGCNGKSTFLETVRDVLGEYAGDIPPSELMLVKRQDHGKATPFLVRLPGVRFVTAQETEEQERLAAALVKAITGGRDTVTARDLYGKAFSFRPQFKLWIATNHRPRISDATSSIWDRIHLIPFLVRIPDPTRGEKPDRKGRIKDPDLDRKLRKELPGILAWMVEGWRSYQGGGLKPPATVLAATEEYRKHEDTAGQFIEDCLVLVEGRETTTKALKSCLEDWCVRSGETIGWGAITRRFRDLAGVRAGKVDGDRGWHGVGIASG